mmetsp:Transcript_15098/g.27281  ORF Transcript_15098/g.27281 Transcript_15098/m.27281 type:complete len:324 (+) Transcript_15098:185-1156(+)|eukprot:CAMPEP_0201638286 /NCGR_PEP_ID=MMETSP0493-20130528/16163_1 /ASSEMBLY_ACC=CAM_ASM_000838 /TAXON_ID=420259 /ORGANISM="Thalassiosira gravida, Strain GMp14c1" /LENGTH=323 /DNA_ID=CAMNT_0048111257 /DNA_START=20 /DNA_END=991 /DNA_ORIENTATION=+
MRSALALSVAACAMMVHTSIAFTCPSSTTSSFATTTKSHYSQKHNKPILFLASRENEEIELLVPSSLKKIIQKESSIALTKKDSSSSSITTTVRQRIRKAGLKVWERMDTMKAAGLYDDDDGLVPMQMGFKRNVGLLVAAFMFKWYRARFINKIPVWDRQPQWNMVVTSPEQEKELHAYSCKQCGSTIFIARHREWFFKGGNTECTNCGAKGEENFVDIREEVIDSIDDDYFDYESPLDFVSAAERRKLVKQAGGDEELAKQIAIDNVMKNDKDQISGEDESSGKEGGKSDGGGSSGAKKKKKSAPKKKSAGDDIFDELDMDA